MNSPFNRHVGLIVLEVNQSNPNGDPDLESEPRTLEADGRGVISPVSFKRKVRDLVLEDGLAMDEARAQLRLGHDGDPNQYEILESRGRDRDKIKKMDRAEFSRTYWDARVFGNTFLESVKSEKGAEKADLSHFISTGVVQVGVGLSIAPVTIDRMTNTNKSGVQEGKDRGMAPLAFRVVRHGIYTIPYFVNPSMALRNGTTQQDIDLLEYLIPKAYALTASAIRSDVRCLHAWRAIHKSPLGSCPDHLFVDAMTPKLKEGFEESKNREDYVLPGMDSLTPEIKSRFQKIDDLALTAD
jgi:Cas7 group CRISPR-associated protein Csh2